MHKRIPIEKRIRQPRLRGANVAKNFRMQHVSGKQTSKLFQEETLHETMAKTQSCSRSSVACDVPWNASVLCRLRGRSGRRIHGSRLGRYVRGQIA